MAKYVGIALVTGIAAVGLANLLPSDDNDHSETGHKPSAMDEFKGAQAPKVDVKVDYPVVNRQAKGPRLN